MDPLNPPPAVNLSIDVISDVVCPWCYIGKRRLAAALDRLHAREPGALAQVRWHPFQLNPDLPSDGIDRRAYLEAKFGGTQRADENYARVSAAGATVGIAFRFDAIKRQPNTLDAHRLIEWAQRQDDGMERAEPLVEGLFRAYFLEGRFIGDRDVLTDIAGANGFDPTAARALLEADSLAPEVAEADQRARELGVGGVPFFIFDGKVAVSGAQEPETLLDAIAQARAA